MLQIGRPRPSFMERCYSGTGEASAPMPILQASAGAFAASCTNPDAAAVDIAYKSFLSGACSLPSGLAPLAVQQQGTKLGTSRHS